MKEPFIWDHYSDQPSVIKDKQFKRSMRKKELFSHIKTFLTALYILPIAFLTAPFAKRKVVQASSLFAMGIDIDKADVTTYKSLLQELDVKHILIRFPLWQMERLEEYKAFVESFSEYDLLLNVMQDREHIEDVKLLAEDLEKIFTAFKSVKKFQIGTTINRAKWGFFSVNEYLNFYAVAYKLKVEKFKDLELIGSSVIDFEYHYSAHTLFNLAKIKYDAVAALLYVDRRGAPENLQMGLSLSDKISLLQSMISMSPKSKNRLYITETNWPISNTVPYAPTSEKECVSEELYRDYMMRYYLLSFASQSVDSVYWHQLIAAGYGLIDPRGGVLKKRSAFLAYKSLRKFLEDAVFLRLDIKRGCYTMQCLIDEKILLHIVWATEDQELFGYEDYRAYNFEGKDISKKTLKASSTPIFIVMENE